MAIRNPKFVELLVSVGGLPREEMLSLFAKLKDDHFALLLQLLRTGALGKTALGKLWADSLGVAYIDPKRIVFQKAALKLLDERVAQKYQVLPVYRLGDTVTLLSTRPNDISLQDDLEQIMRKKVSLLFSFPDDLADAVEIEYASLSGLTDLSSRIPQEILEQSEQEITESQLRAGAGDQAVVDFTHQMILLAAKERASDIHIEPMEAAGRIRFRVDGVLHERLHVEKSLLSPLVTCLKVMAEVDITEKRRPIDGGFRMPLASSNLDIRLSSIPSIYGEKMVLRLLGMSDATDIPELESLLISRSVLGLLEKASRHANGIFLITGPTGSGKSTTLYAILKRMNGPGVNIMTAEDPVEYRLKGVNQIQINTAADLTFAAALRSFLRQDPDIILVGEIRDLETARIACRAALTGHLVLSTLHTNDSVQALTRLTDIGVEPYMVAPSLVGSMAQRLVRKICGHCKERYALTPEEAQDLFVCDPEQPVYFYRGPGCVECNHTGYTGRAAVHEILLIDDDMRRQIAKDAPIGDIYTQARASGFKNLRYDGIKKVLRGITTLEEIDRIALE
ncbi:GspE/PulE family protein [Thermodesulfobacteriota bacterium]